MTLSHERARIALVFASSRRLADELHVGLEEVTALGHLTEDRLARFTSSERIVLLAFLKRFENAVEAGKRLFRAALVLIAEDVLSMATREMIQAAEREKILASAAEWNDVVRARNIVAHEYAMTPAEAATAVENAVIAAATAIDLLTGALRVIEAPPFTTLLEEPIS